MMLRAATITVGLCLTATACAAEGESPVALVKRGNAALEAESYDQALSAYREAEVGLPESPQLKYNQGLVHYRKGDYVEAKELFAESLSTRDLSLEAAAHYNLGNCAYRQALEKLKAYDEAIKLAREAIGHYRQALELDAKDDDARVNIETARLLIKDLQDKKKKEEEEKKKSQSQPSSQPQSQPSSQPQQPKSQPSSQPKQQQGQDKKEQDQKKQDQKQQDQQGQQQKQEQKKTGAKQQQGKQKMSKEEARRLLQAVRDKERQRRRDQVRKQAVGRVGVDKDW